MRILLISTNKIKAPRPALPMGIAIICAALRSKGHIVECLDLCWETKDQVVVIKKIGEFKPEVVGISVRNLDNLTFLDPQFFAPQIKRIAQCCRKYSNCKVILGGAGFSVCPEEMMKYINADYGIVGEGEQSIVELIDFIEKGEGDLSVISGLYHKQDGIYANNPLLYKVDLNRSIKPDRSIYHERYFNAFQSLLTELNRDTQAAIETIQTKRGCRLECSYCIIRKTEGVDVRLKDPSQVVAEIRYILDSNPNIREIEFVDATFNNPLEHAVQICEEIIRSEIKLKWFCQLSVKYADKELVRLLEKSGCYKVELGTDAFNDSTLEKLNKGFCFDKVIEVDKLLRKSSIEFTHCVFFGGPGEDEEHLKESIANSQRLNPNQVFANLGIRVFSGTKLHEMAIENGVISKDRNMLLPTFYVEPEVLARSHLLDMLEEKVKSETNWYLWWGIGGTPLKERVPEVLEILKKMEEEFIYESRAQKAAIIN